jgi:hypothetical protein
VSVKVLKAFVPFKAGDTALLSPGLAAYMIANGHADLGATSLSELLRLEGKLLARHDNCILPMVAERRLALQITDANETEEGAK